jgi:hypothetical protein
MREFLAGWTPFIIIALIGGGLLSFGTDASVDLLLGGHPSESTLAKCVLAAKTTYSNPKQQCINSCYLEQTNYIDICMKAAGYSTKSPRLNDDKCPGIFDYFATACYEGNLTHKIRLWLGAKWEY